MAKRKSRQDPLIRNFILRTIPNEPVAVGARAAQAFGLSRTSTNRYLKSLEEEGLITADGKTSERRYALKVLDQYAATITLTPDLYESDVWMQHLADRFGALPDNVRHISEYGFTEIFNNAIDHSGSANAEIFYSRDSLSLKLIVSDNGIGIFEKIKRDFSLADARTALLELSKGKLTSDKTEHSGEGIYFTSRMFNRFTIVSGSLAYDRKITSAHGVLIETDDLVERVDGTTVHMTLACDASWTSAEIFAKYQNKDWDFSKTLIPVILSRYGKEHLVSRSQAKRLLARFDKFEEVLLDFQGIAEIGQAFADEIFRVFATAHPDVKITALGASDAVKRMIAHAIASNPSTPNVKF